jgi:hypothetical protein
MGRERRKEKGHSNVKPWTVNLQAEKEEQEMAEAWKRVNGSLRTVSFAGTISIYRKSSRIWMMPRIAKRF